MAPNEKLYYGIVVLIAAVSVLLSPFFYVRSGTGCGKPKARKPVAWRLIIASYVIMGALLLAVAYVIFLSSKPRAASAH